MNPPTLNPEDIARYLSAHPEFFDQYPHLLTDLRVTHPFDGRAIPIAERQLLQLREKIAQLETRLGEFVRFGEENDAIMQKLHALTVDLTATDNPALMLAILYRHLSEAFDLPQAVLQLWRGDPDPDADLALSKALQEWVEALDEPECGPLPHEEFAALPGLDAARSFAIVPLRYEGCSGVLVLASTDAQRFYPGMGTLYLQRLGELAAAAFTRAQEPAHHHEQPATD